MKISSTNWNAAHTENLYKNIKDKLTEIPKTDRQVKQNDTQLSSSFLKGIHNNDLLGDFVFKKKLHVGHYY